MKYKKLILSASLAFVLGLMCTYPFRCQNAVRDDFREKLVIDTIYITKTDTMPIVKQEYVKRYIKIPIIIDSVRIDSVPLPIVQRVYSDDSTYTAYISGVQVDSFPRLDSISVSQHNIIIDHEIERIITKKPPITIGLQTGAGYGILSKKTDIYIGLGLTWNF